MVKEKVSRTLTRWPALYNFASKIYYSLQLDHLCELFIGTRARERRWANKSFAAGYWKNREHPGKRLMVESIAEFSPVNSILEVGCASGPGLYLLAKRFPEARIVGVDINREAIEYGKARFAQEGITNVALKVGKADMLEDFPDRAFDIVFTSALLIYIGPDKIRDVIRGMLRVASRALIMMELNVGSAKAGDPSGLGSYYQGNWVRDYYSLMKLFIPQERIKITQIPEGTWPVSPWKEMGAVIQVTL